MAFLGHPVPGHPGLTYEEVFHPEVTMERFGGDSPYWCLSCPMWEQHMYVPEDKLRRICEQYGWDWHDRDIAAKLLVIMIAKHAVHDILVHKGIIAVNRCGMD